MITCLNQLMMFVNRDSIDRLDVIHMLIMNNFLLTSCGNFIIFVRSANYKFHNKEWNKTTLTHEIKMKISNCREYVSLTKKKENL